MNLHIALAGNQNCGKTSLFNQLTGSNQHVGSTRRYRGKEEGTVRKNGTMTVVDLPGIYSLSPFTAEEVVSRDFLVHERPAVIINILDATNIERNLYLTSVDDPRHSDGALNMMDEVRSNGMTIDFAAMEQELGLSSFP